ncbi:MAG: PDZ domain-containing protein [Elusimicrobia bacterium]|nr:PDZ domain-containing protein [Elusimicrobiota bacterium]
MMMQLKILLVLCWAGLGIAAAGDDQRLRSLFDGSRASPQAIAAPVRVAAGGAVEESDEEIRIRHSTGTEDIDVADLLLAVRQMEDVIEGNYPEAISNRYLRDAALEGMLAALDPHSALFRPEVYESFSAQERGSAGFAGVGIVFEKKEFGDYPSVRYPIPGNSAYAAAIKPGDGIIAVDGVDTKNMSMDEVVTRIRGEEGTPVTLTAVSIGEPLDAAREVVLVRREVQNKNMFSAMPAPGVGYIYFGQFIEGVAKEFGDHLTALSAQGMTSLIIDARDNPGGYLNEVIEICSNFLPASSLVITAKSQGAAQEFRTKEAGSWTNLPIAVLINDGSASASEILAGALSDHGRAVLIGSRSYGKGTVQGVFEEFPEPGYAVKLTKARYYLPSGISIDRGGDGLAGLEPTVKVDVEWKIQALLAQERVERMNLNAPKEPARDEVLEKALTHFGAGAPSW